MSISAADLYANSPNVSVSRRGHAMPLKWSLYLFVGDFFRFFLDHTYSVDDSF